MPHIIISYRRADSDAIAGRIRDRLANHFGEESVFMDIDSIPFGTDFREHIQSELAQTDILVAVIGPKWTGPGKGRHLRISEENDPVRIEIETAIKNATVVIPVLVGGAAMPKPSELPDGLKDFSYRNAAEVDAGRDFHPHVERLIRSMERIIADRAKPSAPAASDTKTAGPSAAPSAQGAAVARGGPSAAAPDATAAQAPPPADAAQAAEAAPRQARPRSLRKTALVAVPICLAAVMGAAAWLYLNPKTEVAPPSAVPTQPPPITQPQPTARAPLAETAGCKLDLPATLADDFSALDPAWRLPSQTAYLVESELALKGVEGKNVRLLYAPFRFKNVALCATLKAPLELGSETGTASGGLIFWASDALNFYGVSIYPNGTYAIDRMVAGTWASVTPRTAFASIKSGPGAVNEIRVTTRDNSGTLSINGVMVQEFRGQPPKDDTMIGLYSASNANERNEWRVLNVVAADPDAQQQATAKLAAPAVGPGCKPLRAAAFEDHFKAADPGWGNLASGRVFLADGELVLKPQASRSWRQFYPSLLFGNATICAQLKSPKEVTDINGSTNAGLAFWTTANRRNHYAVSVYPNGRLGILRMVNGEWASVLPATKSEFVKTGLDVTNEIMVTLSGNLAAFYVNGQKAFEFRGQPPRNGGAIGLYAESEKSNENEWRFVDIAVVENE